MRCLNIFNCLGDLLVKGYFGILVACMLLNSTVVGQQSSSSIPHQLTLGEGNVLTTIDLGALPVGQAAEFAFDLTLEGLNKAVVEIESECSCLDVTTAPEVLNAEASPLCFTFTPNGIGSAVIYLNLMTLDLGSGETLTYKLPVKVAGFDAFVSHSARLSSLSRVTPAAAFQQLGAYRVIDIRGAVAYDKARIPGSFEYSLDALLAKGDLFASKVLLVGQPALKKRELDLLQQLTASTTNLLWLDGGMSAWLRQGLPVEGVWPSSTQASTISLNRWLESEPTTAEWQVVDLSNQVPVGESFFGHEVLRTEGIEPHAIQRVIRRAMEDALRKPQGKAVLVIGDARELVYPLAEVAARGDQPIQVLYLKNGVFAYQQWKRGIHAASRPNHQTISLSSSSRLPAPGAHYSIGSAGNSGCSVCPKKR